MIVMVMVFVMNLRLQVVQILLHVIMMIAQQMMMTHVFIQKTITIVMVIV